MRQIRSFFIHRQKAYGFSSGRQLGYMEKMKLFDGGGLDHCSVMGVGGHFPPFLGGTKQLLLKLAGH